MTRNQLYDTIYTLSNCLNTLQVIGEETIAMDEEAELPEDMNRNIGEAILDLQHNLD